MGSQILHKENVLRNASHPLDAIEQRVKTLAEESTRIVPWALLANIALFIPSMILMTIVPPPLLRGKRLLIDAEDRSALAATAVPDDFYADVANLPNASAEGLRYISDLIASKGWLSVLDAQKFVQIERRQTTDKRNASAARREGFDVLKARLAAPVLA
jgi:hypothetical protein